MFTPARGDGQLWSLTKVPNPKNLFARWRDIGTISMHGLANSRACFAQKEGSSFLTLLRTYTARHQQCSCLNHPNNTPSSTEASSN
jgi:hypothetical protein